MSRRFNKVWRRCDHLCFNCGEEVCPLINKERELAAYKKAHRPRILVFICHVLVYAIGVVLAILSIVLLVRPDVLSSVVAELQFEIRIVVALVINIVGGAIMRTAMIRDIRDKVRRMSQ